MRRILAGVFAALFFAVTTASAFHRHADASRQDTCAVCAVTGQARSAPSAAPAISVPVTIVAVFSEAAHSVVSPAVLAVAARGPPSVA